MPLATATKKAISAGVAIEGLRAMVASANGRSPSASTSSHEKASTTPDRRSTSICSVVRERSVVNLVVMVYPSREEAGLCHMIWTRI
jgi:hypothetical protein